MTSKDDAKLLLVLVSKAPQHKIDIYFKNIYKNQWLTTMRHDRTPMDMRNLARLITAFSTKKGRSSGP
jgi:hypothetical protein